MDCSCRTAALRIFVNNIAQIHLPVRVPTPRATRYPTLYSQTSRSCNQWLPSVATATSRALHTSCVRNGTAAPVHAVQEQVKGGSHHADATISEERDEVLADPEHRKRTRRSKKEKDQRRNKEIVVEDHRTSPKEPWMSQKEALKKKFPGGWNPRKKLSPDALLGIRMLHKQFPDEYTTEVLAQKFEVSPEAIRRILKSKWVPDADKEIERQERWFNRGKQVWTHWAALGRKPPRKWRAEGIVRDHYWNTPRGPNHKDKAARAEAQRRLAKGVQ